MKALTHTRFITLLSFWIVASSLALAAGFLNAAPIEAGSGTGQALALRAALRSLIPPVTHARTFAAAGISTNLHHASDGRFIFDKAAMLRPALRSHAAAGTLAQINEAVQTQDVFNPPPTFAPPAGATLTPSNLTPVWTADETMLVFSSNRTPAGIAGTRFHIWAISVNGGTAVQLTDSAAQASETAGLPHGEFFPALSAGNNSQIAFTSDANSPNVQNLYSMPFSATTVEVSTLTSPTISQSNLGFQGVRRPTFAATNSDEIVFSALSTAGTYTGHYHLYFLYVSTGGYNPASASMPAKLTDGPADDTDPAYSQDGQLIAFASTATQLTSTGLAASPNPNTSPVITSSPGTNRSIFVIGGGGRFGFATVPNGGAAVTLPGTDNFGPAWSYTQSNPYTNPAPGFEYIAFARGASPTSPHDIDYLQLLQSTDANGETSLSNEAATTPLTPATPVYQLNSGAPPGTQTLVNGGNSYVPDQGRAGGVGGVGGFFVNGGTADVPAPPPAINTTNDPGTPPALYNTDRSGTFTYTFRNLTPNATYTVRLHLADPKETAVGARIFNLTLNGTTTTRNIDIFRDAGGGSTAVVENFTTTVPTTAVTDTNGLIIAPAGAITVAFNPVSGDPPIVQGIEIISDNTVVSTTTATPPTSTFTSSGFGALGGTGFPATFGASAPPFIVSALGGVFGAASDGTGGQPQVVVTFINPSSSTPSAFNVYRSPAQPTAVNTPSQVGTGTEGSTPFSANATINPVLDANGNQVFDPTTGFPQFSFTDTQVTLGSEYFYEISAVYRQTLAPESASNPVIHLNTDDNAGETSTAGNAFDDIYPTWSPFLSVFSIAYSSNRTVTYNNPTTSTPSETAISVGQGGSLGGGATVGTAYAGILESQVVNLDPPTLIPYSGNEILHVADSSGVTTRTGITPGQAVTVTVRLSSREAGVDDSNIYLQIKDPDSKYQDAQGLEHKVFAHDPTYRFQANNPNFPDLLDSGSSDMLMNGGGYTGFNQFTIGGETTFFDQRGSVGGLDAPPAGAGPVGPNANRSDTISVGRDGGGTNANQPVDNKGALILDANKNPIVLSGGDPTLFIPWGPEFECQVVNPQFAGSGGAKFQTGDTAPTDYRDPYFLAGIDDQQPFSGNKFVGGSLRPTTNTPSASGGNTIPAEWLQMTKLPAAQQDNQGGILYSVNWTTPTSGSDYYLDVIAFDNAVAPQTAVLSGNSGSNWRIYDNIWGFSTAASISNNDILVVSDYALGQKFAASTFGGQRGLLNLVPKLYGAESYVTDMDVNLLPNAIYRTTQFKGANNFNPEVFDLGTIYSDGSPGTPDTLSPVLNGLGVGSYDDTFIDDGSVIDGRPAVHSQLYSLWRILARGPVPAALYKAYQPTFQAQPAVTDPIGNVTAAAGSVPVANRCILWFSPFTGDVLAGPGTLADTATQASLRQFVAGGGRLCVSGQDVGSTLTQGGTTSNGQGSFISDVLGATLKTSGGGTHLPNPTGTSGTDNRITNLPFFDAHLFGNYPEFEAGGTINNVVPGQRPIIISNNYGGNIYEDVLVFTPGFSGNWRTDGSLDQLGPYIQPFPATSNNSVVAQIDTITPNQGAHVDISLNPFTNPIGTTGFGNNNPDAASGPGGVGLIYTETPVTTPGTGGSKVVYSTFGLEALSTEYYRQTLSFKPNPEVYVPRNQRQNILHNIVDYLRTGSITGTVRATSGNGVVGGGVAGVTVYVQDAYGAAIAGRGVYSATSDAGGNFRIDGLEPGNYTLVALKGGYVRTTSNPGIVFTIEGDTTVQASLTMTPAATGSLSGKVTDPTGVNGIAGATVTFISSSAQTISTTTDANGNYSLPTIPADTYTGTASLAGSSTSAVQTIVVVSGVASTANFTLTPGPGTVTGTVRDPSGNPVSGATVYFSIGSPATLTSTTPTGASGVYTISLVAGTYSAIGSATGFTNSTPVNIIVSSGGTTSQDITLGAASATGTLGGLVTASTSVLPLASATLSVVNTGTGQTLTPAPVTVGTAATGPDNGQINYGPLTLQPGNYLVTVSKNGVSTGSQPVTVTSGTFTRLDFTGTNGLPPLHTFPAGLNFLSLPFDYSGFSFDSVFGVLNTAPTGTTPNGNRSHVAVWDPTASNGNGNYALDPTAPADAIRLGVGYWIYLKNPVGLTQAAAAPSGTVTVALHPSWNQIGVPNSAGIPVLNLTFDMGNGQQPLTFAQATSSQNHVVSPTLFSFNGSTYQAVATTDTLQPYQAYWIKVYTNTTLDMPTGQ